MPHVFLAVLLAVVLSKACVAQPPPPPPADPTWASTEGPAWNSFACPDGSVVFTAHLGGPRSLFFSDPTGEVELTREVEGEDSRWVGGGVVQRHEPERRIRIAVEGQEIGGGACVNDRTATIRDRLEGLEGVCIVDTRMNPKPKRVGLYLPDGVQSASFRAALFLGADRVCLRPEDISESRSGPSNRPGLWSLGLRIDPDRFASLRDLYRRHAAQPLALVVDGVLVARIDWSDSLAANDVIAAHGLSDAHLDNLRLSLDL